MLPFASHVALLTWIALCMVVMTKRTVSPATIFTLSGENVNPELVIVCTVEKLVDTEAARTATIKKAFPSDLFQPLHHNRTGTKGPWPPCHPTGIGPVHPIAPGYVPLQ